MASRPLIPASKILQEASTTIQSRVPDYDTPAGDRTMLHATEIFNAIKQNAKEVMSEQDGWLFMLSLKIARSRQGKPKLDTYVGMASYAGLMGECALTSKSQEVEP